jgi:nicotinamidase-related amidase
MNQEDTILVVVDIQDKFLPVIKDIDKLIDNAIKLIKSFQIMNVSIVLTEQYSKGLGKTVKRITNVLNDYNPIEKITFDCFGNKYFLKSVEDKKNLVICGIESHVCVTQTMVTALKKGFNVYLVKDAISSRKESDKKIAIERAKQEGAKIVSTEMVIFELLGEAGTEVFKEVSKIVKD